MQRYRTVIILVLLVVVPFAAAAVAARFILPGSGAGPIQEEAKPAAAPPVEKEKTRKVLAAARGLPVGTLLTEGDLAGLDLPASEIKRGYVVMDDAKAIDALRGHAVREALVEGAPLSRSAIVGPRQRGFLAAVLRPGTRAVTIRLGEGTRHAGLIDPGDRVDVILTAKLRLDDRARSAFARTILEDVRVVAVDRQVGTSVGTAEDGKQVKRTKILTATLEVSPIQADRLALGEHEGELSLAVRSLAGTAQRRGNEAVDLEELLSLTKTPPAPPPPPAALPAPAPVEETRRVFVAARSLPAGTLLKEDYLTELEFERDEVPRGYVPADGRPAFDALRGHATRQTVLAGQTLTWSAVVGPGQRGFLAAVLKPGTRAVTIRLGEGARHAGLIDPEDRVDVILTAKLPLADGAQSVLTRRILENARVVAVDRRLGSGADPAQGNSPAGRARISTATLEVSPAQADRLALGEHQGTLALAVRSLAAPAGNAQRDVVDLRQLLAYPASEQAEEPAPAATPGEAAPAPSRTVRVIRGNKLTEQTFPDPSEPRPDAARPGRAPGIGPDREPDARRTASRARAPR